VDADILPGAVVLVLHRGEIVVEEAVGFRDKENRRRQRKDDYFFLASSSKPLAVTAILTLVDDGKLALDQPPLREIPALQQARLSNGEPVRACTLRQMLSHTSGMFGMNTARRNQYRLVWNFRGTLSEAADQITQQPLVYPPGCGFSYGGASITVAARAAEIAARRDFDEVVHARVFAPLGMDDTFYRTSQYYYNRFAILYEPTSKGLQRRQAQPRARPGGYVLAPGGIIATARDVARFLQMHLGGGTLNGRRILSVDLARESRRDQTQGRSMDDFRSRGVGISDAAWIGKAEGYGLGWVLDEIGPDGVARIFYHGGAFGTLIWADAESELGVVLLSHVPSSQVASLWNEIMQVVRGYFGVTPESPSRSYAPPIVSPSNSGDDMFIKAIRRPGRR
jgi:CubicO group peptidase (beta-lactamase class C family)